MANNFRIHFVVLVNTFHTLKILLMKKVSKCLRMLEWTVTSKIRSLSELSKFKGGCGRTEQHGIYETSKAIYAAAPGPVS